LCETGDLDGAVASYRRALEINIDHAGVHFNLGTALHDQDKREDAVASYRPLRNWAMRPPGTCLTP
jgi:Tfp pilus assembly protein PilF